MAVFRLIEVRVVAVNENRVKLGLEAPERIHIATSAHEAAVLDGTWQLNDIKLVD